MKSVLMIAYGFPPQGHAGVFRPLRFVRHLPAHSWKPTVVSASGMEFERYDPELLSQVPADVEVIRPVDPGDLWQSFQRWRARRAPAQTPVSAGTPAAQQQPGGPDFQGRLRGMAREIVRLAESCWYHPDLRRNWIAPATDAAVQACRRQRPDVIWASGPPWSSFLVAENVSRRTGVPYVLDFRTSWTIVPSPFEAARPMWAQRRDRKALRRLLAGARAVVFFYAAEAECFWRMYEQSLDPSRIHVIPNGFDGPVADFVEPPRDTFTLLYTGVLADYRYDTFVDALAMFKEANPTAWRRLKVKFVGEQEPGFLERVNALGLRDAVTTHPPMPHSQMPALQRDAHALLMLERRPSHKGYELLAGAKLFNYLKAARPIMGVVPEGEAARVLRDVGVSTIANADAPEAICEVLQRLFDGWASGRLSSFVPDRTLCEDYSAEHQTEALARALTGMPPLRPFVPGAVDIVPSLRADFSAARWT